MYVPNHQPNGNVHGNKIGNIRRGKIKASGHVAKNHVPMFASFSDIGGRSHCISTWTREKSRDFFFRICKEPTKKVDSAVGISTINIHKPMNTVIFQYNPINHS